MRELPITNKRDGLLKRHAYHKRETEKLSWWNEEMKLLMNQWGTTNNK